MMSLQVCRNTSFLSLDLCFKLKTQQHSSAPKTKISTLPLQRQQGTTGDFLTLGSTVSQPELRASHQLPNCVWLVTSQEQLPAALIWPSPTGTASNR